MVCSIHCVAYQSHDCMFVGMKTMDESISQVTPSMLAKQLNISNAMQLDRRIRAELEQLGRPFNLLYSILLYCHSPSCLMRMFQSLYLNPLLRRIPPLWLSFPLMCRILSFEGGCFI